MLYFAPSAVRIPWPFCVPVVLKIYHRQSMLNQSVSLYQLCGPYIKLTKTCFLLHGFYMTLIKYMFYYQSHIYDICIIRLFIRLIYDVNKIHVLLARLIYDINKIHVFATQLMYNVNKIMYHYTSSYMTLIEYTFYYPFTGIVLGLSVVMKVLSFIRGVPRPVFKLSLCGTKF